MPVISPPEEALLDPGRAFREGTGYADGTMPADETTSTPTQPGLTERQVVRAIRFSYAQSMLGAVYGASTGGMFLIGYALMLGATNVQIGLMSTIPMLCVGAQLVAATLIERGVGRRALTIMAAGGNVLGWLPVILIPYALARTSIDTRIASLIVAIAGVTFFAHLAGNARGSWLGDLVPAHFRGSFFGRITMFGGIIGSLFAIVEGSLLDRLRGMGAGAFGYLFGFGVLVGLVHVALFLPQPDLPVARTDVGGLRSHVRATFRNRSLMTVALFAMLWSMQVIAWPFFSTYMIRDLEMSYMGIGLVNSVLTVSMLLSGPFWGRMTDRYGCRAVLTVCSFALGLLQLVWLGVNSAGDAYRLLPPVNVAAGLSVSGVSVALSTLVYKVTPAAGRAIQFAVYSILVTVTSAPMPIIGGKLPDWLAEAAPGADLRVTFYACLPLLFAAGLVARCIHEPESSRTRVLLRALPGHVRETWQRVVPGLPIPGRAPR